MVHKRNKRRRAEEASRDESSKPAAFDYEAPAELYSLRSRKGAGMMRYQRFDTAAEAVRCAVEQMTAQALLGASMEVGDVRYGSGDIRRLYESSDYPLARRSV